MSAAKKWLIWLAAAVIAMTVLLTSPMLACLRSMAVMSLISGADAKKSLPALADMSIDIPSAPGWYPFVLTFNADSTFAARTGDKEARLTILYSFPAFDHAKGCSRLFDESSPYYTSFYGAYVARLSQGAYGFESEIKSLDEAVSDLAKLDLFGLVLGDFGLNPASQVFEYSESSRTDDIEFAGSGGWTELLADMRANGAGHEAQSGVKSYWQYGRPNFPIKSPFAPIDMKCAVYAKYFPKQNVSVFFYAMAADQKVLDDCVENLLSQSIITEK